MRIEEEEECLNVTIGTKFLSKVAFASTKNSQNMLLIDEIIPIKVNSPNIKMSKKK